MTIEKKPFSVAEITFRLKELIEERFHAVKVLGEVSNFKLSSSGHYYFSLKDPKAQLQCVLFKGKIPPQFQLTNGDSVIVEGSINLYEPSGAYQLIASAVYKQGNGELLARIQALKEHYAALGYFDEARKKRLPTHPRSIGVVTSPHGAVIQDIIKVLNHRVDAYHLIIAPVKVQGGMAAREIAHAIDRFNALQNCDVIIVARGGGSIEDLMPFNDPAVIEAAYRSKLPLISAIGHETDFTLLDFVSDQRAATPSMAAQLVMSATLDLIANIRASERKIHEALRRIFAHHHKNLKLQTHLFIKKRKLESMNHAKLTLANADDKLLTLLSNLINLKARALHTASKWLKDHDPCLIPVRRRGEVAKLNHLVQQKITYRLEQLATQSKRLTLSTFHPILINKLQRHHQMMKAAKMRLHALNPRTILKKGYCIPMTAPERRIIRSVDLVPPHQSFELLFHDGSLLVNSSTQVNHGQQ